MEDRLDIGGSLGLDNSNMDKSSSVCGYSDTPGKFIIFFKEKHIYFFLPKDHNKHSSVTLHLSDWYQVENTLIKQLLKFERHKKTTSI